MRDERPAVVRWREAVASSAGPPSTTRHVLLTLSLDADMNGGSCYPSTRRLAERTGLSRRTVEDHIRSAEAEGWILRSEQGEGQAWRRMGYTLQLPDVGKELPHLTDGRGEGGSPASANVGKEVPQLEPEGGESDAEGGERDSPDVVTTRSTTTTTTHPPESETEDRHPKLADLPRTDGGHRVYPTEFEGAYQALPDRSPRHEKGKAYRAWLRLVRDGADPFRLEAAADAYAEDMTDAGDTGTRFVKLAATFFGPSAVWEDYSGTDLSVPWRLHGSEGPVPSATHDPAEVRL